MKKQMHLLSINKGLVIILTLIILTSTFVIANSKQSDAASQLKSTILNATEIEVDGMMSDEKNFSLSNDKVLKVKDIFLAAEMKEVNVDTDLAPSEYIC